MPLSSSERVVLDATLMVTPAADAGLALHQGAGQVRVPARLADDRVRGQTVLLVRADRNTDPAAHVEMPDSSADESTSIDLTGGVYAVRLHVTVDPPERDTSQ